jgi:hypothetical protein
MFVPGNACVILLSTGVAVRIMCDHFSRDVVADTVVACLSDPPSALFRVMCIFKSGRLMPVALGLDYPELGPTTAHLSHSVDIVVEWEDSIAITSSSLIYIYSRNDLMHCCTISSVEAPRSIDSKSADQLIAPCTTLPQVPSSACALAGHGGMLAVSCDAKLVVIMRRDYRVMAAPLNVCHSMVAAGPCLLATVGKDGALRVMRICIQQQHILLHLIWVGDHFYDRPIFGILQASSSLPSAFCAYLPDASVMRLAVCPACDILSTTNVSSATNRSRVVVSVVHAAGNSECPGTQQTAVLFDDGFVSLWSEDAVQPIEFANQIHIVPFNNHLRLLGLFGRWVMLCDGGSIRIFDCGIRHAPPDVTSAITCLVQQCTGIDSSSRALKLADNISRTRAKDNHNDAIDSILLPHVPSAIVDHVIAPFQNCHVDESSQPSSLASPVALTNPNISDIPAVLHEARSDVRPSPNRCVVVVALIGLQGLGDAVMVADESQEGVATAAAASTPAAQVVVLGCWINDPKAWIKKWKSVHLAVDVKSVAWASAAADASSALEVSSKGSKGATVISIVGCSVEAVEGSVDGKQNVVRLTLMDNIHVSAFIHNLLCSCVILTFTITARIRV